MKKLSAFFYALIIIFVGLCAWFISNNCFQLLLISGDSMAPTYSSGSFALVDRRGGDYAAGDVVLFHCEGLGRNLVKRIAAVPGDRLAAEQNTLYINGTAAAPLPPEEERSLLPECVPENTYLMLGDNVGQSVDSRYAEVGLVDGSQLIGRLTPAK